MIENGTKILYQALRYTQDEQRKFFYDHFTQEDVCGLFNLPQLLWVLAFFSLAALTLFFARKLTVKRVGKLHFWIAIAVTVMEATKVAIRVYKRQGADDWMPLFYCSLFVFAVWLALCKNKTLQTVGYSYMVMGGIMASVFFTVYPSTSLALFPIWHPSTIYSFVYHFLMFFLGALIAIKKIYVPATKHALHYFLFILAASVPSVIFNETIGTNCMFLRHAFGLPFLSKLETNFKVGYIALVFFAQASLMFWGNYAIYLAVQKLSKKRADKPDEQPAINKI